LTEPKHVAFDIAKLSVVDSWTDEQWAEHDARVAADRAGSAEPLALARPNLEDLDWPARALRIARSADRSRVALASLLKHDFTDRSVAVLSGFAGCGKTVAAAAWALGSGLRVRFLRAATFAASSRYDAEARAQWFGAQALVLDDLGAEYLDAKGSFLVDLDELVDTFYGDERPLVITTNLQWKRDPASKTPQPPQLVERYGERVARRLRECAKFYSVGGAS
jgi:DNA replication protein DnaC